MNKRIKELARQATICRLSAGNSEADDASLARFAKLLIEECAVAAELHARSYSDGDAGDGCYGAAAAVRCVGRDDE